MLKRHVCPKCSHNRILLVRDVADADEGHRPMQIAITFAGTGMLGGVKTRRQGKVSAAVCKSCGYTELYTADPESIFVDGDYVTEVTGPDSTTPFR